MTASETTLGGEPTPRPAESGGNGAARAVGLVDVARLARVSPSTASRALRGGRVSQDRRERVLRAAEQLDYVPLQAAVRLSSGRGRTVAIVLPTVSRWFFVEVAAGAARALRSAGYDLLLHDVPPDAGSGPEVFADLLALRGRVDALLLVAAAGTDADAVLRDLRVPAITIGGRPHLRGRVGIDDAEGAATAVRHLLALGHRDVAMIAGEVGAGFGRAASELRRRGFTTALAEAGLPVPPEAVVSRPWGIAGGARAMEELLGRGRLPSAVFAESDEMAFGALGVLRRSGLSVPGDVSVVGFDDHEMAATLELTTVHQPVAQQGETAAALLVDLLDRLSREPGAPAPPEVVLPTRLVVRTSTAPPRG